MNWYAKHRNCHFIESWILQQINKVLDRNEIGLTNKGKVESTKSYIKKNSSSYARHYCDGFTIVKELKQGSTFITVFLTQRKNFVSVHFPWSYKCFFFFYQSQIMDEFLSCGAHFCHNCNTYCPNNRKLNHEIWKLRAHLNQLPTWAVSVLIRESAI